MPTQRHCLVCGSEFRPQRTDAKTCTDVCRQRLHRGRRFDYLAGWPPARLAARLATHQAIADAIAIERMVKAARRERRKLARRIVRTIAPLTRGPSRGGGFMD
jgi:hypothetical protein